MKNFLLLIVALIAAWIVWHIIVNFVFGLFHIVVIIAMIALFVWLVSAIYQGLTRQKI